MKKIKLVLLLLTFISASHLIAKDYNASLFGIKSNGTTMNTNSIQRAIDHISEKGGGRLVFYVGRYLTGTINLKSNVHIVLNEGAVLLGSTNIYDYNIDIPYCSFIRGEKQDNISITGKGVIDGQGKEVAYGLLSLIHNGIIEDVAKYDRPFARRPRGIYLRECTNVEISGGIMVKNAADWVVTIDQCENVKLDKVTVDSKAYWNNDGIDIVDCKNLTLTNSFVDATDDGICLKSHDKNKTNDNIVVRNCAVRSSANGIKFGTASNGGFKNIKMSNIKVYDTFRSAFTIQGVDGAVCENISIDSLYVYNTGNIIYLRLGERGNRKSIVKDISISNVYAELSDSKQPDLGYTYDGPIENEPRNISPCGIVGLEGQYIENVTLKNIEIISPAGGNPHYAKVGLSTKELDAIPEMPKAYPEFSQFKELPAWGFYIRHAKNIKFDNVTLKAKIRDYRPAIVLDDVIGADLTGLKITEPGGGKKQIHEYKSSNIKK